LGSIQGTETIKLIEFKFNVNAEFVVGLMLIKELVNFSTLSHHSSITMKASMTRTIFIFPGI